MSEATVELTQEQQIMVRAIVTAVREELKHDCFFDQDSRKILHDAVDAAKDEAANRETFIIVYRIGNGVRSAMKRTAQAFVWFLIMVAAIGVAAIFGRSFGWGFIK